MMKTKISMLILSFISVALLFTACGNDKQENTKSNAEQLTLNKGELAPMFELTDLDGNNVALADFAGEKVYVKYWATWCSICLAGLEELNTLSSGNNDFEVISIVNPNFNGEMSSEDFTKWFKNQETDQITVLLDQDGIWAQKFGLIGYPNSFYIGSDSVLVHSTPGHHSNELITDMFADIK